MVAAVVYKRGVQILSRINQMEFLLVKAPPPIRPVVPGFNDSLR
jgi:hypothetical protein